MVYIFLFPFLFPFIFTLYVQKKSSLSFLFIVVCWHPVVQALVAPTRRLTCVLRNFHLLKLLFFCAVVHIGSEKLIQGFQTGQYFFSKEERWLLFHIGFSLSATPQTTAPIFHIFFNHTAFFGQAFCYLVVLLYPSFGRFLLHVCMSCCGAHYIFVTE